MRRSRQALMRVTPYSPCTPSEAEPLVGSPPGGGGRGSSTSRSPPGPREHTSPAGQGPPHADLPRSQEVPQEQQAQQQAGMPSCSSHEPPQAQQGMVQVPVEIVTALLDQIDANSKEGSTSTSPAFCRSDPEQSDGDQARACEDPYQ